MSYRSSRQTKTTNVPSNSGPETKTTKETTTIQKPTKYTETIVRIGRRGDKSGIQEFVTKKYNQAQRVQETKTTYDPKTGATQKVTTVGYQPQSKVVTESRRIGGTTTTQTTTSTGSKNKPVQNVIVSGPRFKNDDLSKSMKEKNPNQPSVNVTSPRSRYGGLSSSMKETTTTTTTNNKNQPQTTVTETRRRYGPVTTSFKQTTTTTSGNNKNQPQITVTETRRRYGPVTTSIKETSSTTSINNKNQPQITVTEPRSRYGPLSKSTKETTTTTTISRGNAVGKRFSSYTPDEEGYVTVPIRVNDTSTNYGLDKKSSKDVTYITYQRTRPKPLSNAENYVEKDNKVFTVSEKRTEKYSNNNGNEQRTVTIEKNVNDVPQTRGYRRFYASKK